MTILTGIFFLSHPNTYRFEPKNILDSISLHLLTTNIHFGINLWYGFITLLSLIVLFGSLLAVITIITGESSGLDHHMRDMNGASQMLDSLITAYPFTNSFGSCLSGHTIALLIGGLSIYGIYSLLKHRNQPIKRLRIQI
jgi:hypothetical protein